LAHQERVNIAVFIDFDNIEIGVKSTLGEHFDIGTILEALKERGEVVTKIAYADWTRAGEYSRNLTQHAIRLVQRNLTPGGDKNGADINLALDALEMAFTHPHINAYVIVGGDSDFLSLVEKLKQYDKKVFVVGGRAFTSVILQRNCHEFIAYENLIRRPAPRPGRPATQQGGSALSQAFPLAQAFPLVRRALKILADREVSPQTGLLKSTLLQLDSTFSERNYGASSFLDFAEKLSQAGLVQLKHTGRSVMVELNPNFADEGEGAGAERPRTVETAQNLAAVPANGVANPAPTPGSNVHPFKPAASQEPAQELPPPAGDQAEGVRLAAQVLGAPGVRWPMYVRNAKQLFRAAALDERRYGFGGLIDLLRACQRENILRLERDRRGGLRAFQGPALAASSPARPASRPEPSFEDQPMDEPVVERAASPEIVIEEGEVVEAQPIAVVDTTAELLGRAKPKKPRAARGARKTETKKTAPRRAARARKPAVAADET
jgi:uncharacterized LabA/DUF88 family protein